MLVVAQAIKAVVRDANPMSGTFDACVEAAQAHASAVSDAAPSAAPSAASSVALALALRPIMERLDNQCFEFCSTLFCFLNKVAKVKVRKKLIKSADINFDEIILI